VCATCFLSLPNDPNRPIGLLVRIDNAALEGHSARHNMLTSDTDFCGQKCQVSRTVHDRISPNAFYRMVKLGGPFICGIDSAIRLPRSLGAAAFGFSSVTAYPFCLTPTSAATVLPRDADEDDERSVYRRSSLQSQRVHYIPFSIYTVNL
jgi:hypothetical protein